MYQQSADRVLNNAYLYQGKELQDEAGLELYDFHARQYDPLLGRMNSIDPIAASFDGMSPYAGMGNNPVNIIDPTGEFLMFFSLKTALIGAGIGGVAGGVIAETQGKNFWKGFGYGAAIGFAAGGFAGSDFAKVNIWKTHVNQGVTKPIFRNAKEPFKWLRKINDITPKGGAKFGSRPIAKAVGQKLFGSMPRLPQLPDLPGLDLPVSRLLDVTQPHFDPPATDGVSMVDQTRVFGNTMPNMQPQIATGQNILRNIARYLNVVNQTGQPPQSISITGVNTNFANQVYTSTSVNGGITNIVEHGTSRALQNRLNFIKDELIRLGAPPQSVGTSPANFNYGVGNSFIRFRYGN